MVSGDIDALEFINQPLAEGSADEELVVQSSLKMLDKFGNKVPVKSWGSWSVFVYYVLVHVMASRECCRIQLHTGCHANQARHHPGVRLNNCQQNVPTACQQ